MNAWLGLALFPLVGAATILTGAPAFLLLIGAACLGFGLAWISGDAGLAAALPGRVASLMESDLLQALPLFALMGALLNRLALADLLFRVFMSLAGKNRAAPALSALALGTLLAPMNGSVGASVTMLSRSVRPQLAKAGVPAPRRTALIAAAGTLGVIVPPSLVLIFLGDAMMAAHTIALNASGASDRVINTQDLFRAALAPGALLILSWALISLRAVRAAPCDAQPVDLPGLRDKIVALTIAAGVAVLLGGVTAGYFYAVEAAAMGCVCLIVAGLFGRRLSLTTLRLALRETLALSGALFALLVAATAFTLSLRMLGSDKLLAQTVSALPGGGATALAVALLIIGACAFVLDAIEIVFVVIPLLMPAVLTKATDAPWVAAVTLLALQASYLIPPMGYAAMMSRAMEQERMRARELIRALGPWLLAALSVIAVTIAAPSVTHLFDKAPAQATAPRGALPNQFDLPEPDAPPAFAPPKF